VHHLLYEELSLGMEHHIYVPLHEAELRLALEIGHGILCEKELSFASKRGELGHSSLQVT
jgi:hypothetical protein